MKKLVTLFLAFVLLLSGMPAFAQGPFYNTSVALSSNMSGASSDAIVGFRVDVNWDADGYLKIEFDNRFGLSGITKVESSDIDGSFTFLNDGNVLYIWRDGDGSVLMEGTTVDDLKIFGLVNPNIDDSYTYLYKLSIYDGSESLIGSEQASATYIQKAVATHSNGTSVTVDSPNGGEMIEGEDVVNISWTANGIDNVKISMSSDWGDTFSDVIAEGFVGEGPYAWVVPNVDVSHAMIMIEGFDRFGKKLASDISDADFSISLVEVMDYEEMYGDETGDDGFDEEFATPLESVSDHTCEIGLMLKNHSLISGSDSSAVYFVSGSERFVFPSEAVYFSWFDDFEDVVTVPECSLGQFQIGSRITMRPGSLIKIQSDPKVYAVDSDYQKRYIDSEETAALLFGDDWNKKIVDIDVMQYVDYPNGEALTSDDVGFDPYIPQYPR